MRTSKIWAMPREEFIRHFESVKSVAELLAVFGLSNKGSNYQTIRSRCEAEGLGWNALSKRWYGPHLKALALHKRKTLKDLLIPGCTYNRQRLKKRLLKAGLLQDECSLCGSVPVWQGRPLVLILDHINGNPTDCRLENLRLLCPNCNSQTETFAGRQLKGRKTTEPNRCKDCSRKISFYAVRCKRCKAINTRKAVRPSLDVLKSEVAANGLRATGRKYGVTGSAISHWIHTAP